MGDEKTDSKLWGFTESFFIFLAPVVAYCFCFIYQCGYYSYFKLPIDLISIDVTKILIATALMLLFFKKSVIGFFLTSFAKKDENNAIVAAGFIPSFFLAVNVYLATDSFLIAFIDFELSVMFTFLLIAIRHERRKIPSAVLGITDLTYWLNGKYAFEFRQQIFIGQCVLYLAAILFLAAYDEARHQERFLVFSSDNSTVVVDVDENRAVCLSLERCPGGFTNVIANRLLLLPAPQKMGQSLDLTVKAVGPLNTKDVLEAGED